jgi:retinol dehydrogenase 12
MMARSQAKANEAIESIKAAAPKSTGSLVFIPLHYDGLANVKSSVDRFLAGERCLHVFFNNAGLQGSDPLDRTTQGAKAISRPTAWGPLLLFKLRAPVLAATADDPATPPDTVRTVWVSSLAAELFSDKHTGFRIDNLDYRKDVKNANYRYGISKLGNWAYAVDPARRNGTASDGNRKNLIHLSVNPGNLCTDLFYHWSAVFKMLTCLGNYTPINGAYTSSGSPCRQTLRASGPALLRRPLWSLLPPAPRSRGRRGEARERWW